MPWPQPYLPFSLVAGFAPLCPLLVLFRFSILTNGPCTPSLSGPLFWASLGTSLTPLSLDIPSMESATPDFGSTPN